MARTVLRKKRGRSESARTRDIARLANKRAWRVLWKKPRTLAAVRRMYEP
jgi:hypothetical protein